MDDYLDVTGYDSSFSPQTTDAAYGDQTSTSSSKSSAGVSSALAAAGPYGIAAATIFQVVGGLQSAQNIEKAAAINNQVAQLNAQYEQLDAHKALEDGMSNEARYADVITATQNEQQNAEAAKGQSVTFGTASEITADTQISGFQNQLNIKNAANAKAMGFETEAVNTILAGALGKGAAQQQASEQQSVGVLKGISTGVAGITQTPRNTGQIGGFPGIYPSSPSSELK